MKCSTCISKISNSKSHLPKKKMKCLVCGNTKNFHLLVMSEDMRWECFGTYKYIVQCRHCKFIFLTPQWTNDELDMIYKNFFAIKDFKGQIQAPRINKYLKKYVENKTCLEIGCGQGDNIKYVQKYANEILGIDKKQPSCPAYHIASDYRKLTDKFGFEFIYAIQVFEHIKNPKDFIKRIMNSLLVNGKFLLEFPNTEDILLGIKKFQKFSWNPLHLYFWTPATVKQFFKQMGIKVKIKRQQNYGLINHLRWLIFKRPGNWHPNIPVLDDIYKFILTQIIRRSDTILVIGEKNG